MGSTDTAAFKAINGLGESYSFLDNVFIFFAEYSIIIIFILMIIMWFYKDNYKKRRQMIICSVASVIVGEIIGKIIGLAVEHTQPFATLEDARQLIDHGIDNSFPSDHTIVVFAIAITMLVFRRDFLTGLVFIIAILTAFSRIAVGVHWPSDVIAGLIVAIIATIIVILFAAITGLPDKIVAVIDTFIAKRKRR